MNVLTNAISIAMHNFYDPKPYPIRDRRLGYRKQKLGLNIVVKVPTRAWRPARRQVVDACISWHLVLSDLQGCRNL